MRTLLLALCLAGCATVPFSAKLACTQTCATWARATGRRGPVMSVVDPRVCACMEADAPGESAPAYHSEPVPPAPPLVAL